MGSQISRLIRKISVKNQNLISKSIRLGLFEEAEILRNADELLNNLLVVKEEKLPDGVERLYIWRTQGDDKVRGSHEANEGKVFLYDNPPPTGNPGEAHGCRCYAQPIPKEKPVVLSKSPSEVSIYFTDGSKTSRVGGSRAWRNNNPGNIRAGKFANDHDAIGEAGGFAVFLNEESGREASKELLKTSSYSKLTIDEAIARRSPSSENNTRKLQQDIRKIGGFSGQEIVGLLGEAEINRLLNAIRRTEGWIEGEIIKTPAPE